jgi:uncharacterized protein
MAMTTRQASPITVSMPMRDAVTLRARLWQPAGDGPFPTVLLRTPYANDEDSFERLGLDAYVAAGYAVVFQSVRGTGDSDGEFGFLFAEGADGYDSIEWIAQQSWSNGRVAMDGGSYLGSAQWLAARERPPHLVCIMPAVAAGDYFRELPFVGGALQVDWAFSWLSARSGEAFDFGAAGDTNLERFRPLCEAESVLARELPFFREILQHPRLDDYWRRIQFGAADFAQINVPALVTTGWFDGDLAGALFYWQGLETELPRSADSRLIIGPWQHVQCYLGGEASLDDMQFGEHSRMDLQAQRLAFLDHHMRDSSALWPQRVQIFMTGRNSWQGLPDYARPAPTPWYLDSDGQANTRSGNGRLCPQRPCGPPDSFLFDPADPVPYRPAARDHGDLEDRQDVMVYTSAPLSEALSLLGPVDLELHASSDGPDTDFTAKLLDVTPDGRAISLTHGGGVLRARFRLGFDREVFLVPGEPARLSIRLNHVGHSFLPGHRLRLEVSSSCFPLADPNPNTGTPTATESQVRVARQTLWHDGDHPSRIWLPIISENALIESGIESPGPVARSQPTK